MLKVNNISHSFTYNNFFRRKTLQILNNISFQIQQGENVALIGPSGCGKSTLARIIAQLQKPTSGSISFQNETIILQNLMQRRAFYKRLQILFQDPLGSLNPRYNVLANLQEPLKYLLNIKDLNVQLQEIYKILELLSLPKSILYHYPSMLSGGQAQRVCIARILLIKPQFVILDESTSGLDYELQDAIWNLFLNMQNNHNTTFLFITHDIILAKKYCQKLIIMENGRIVETISQNGTFNSHLGKELMSCYEYML